MDEQNQFDENTGRAIGFISKDDENGFILGNYYLLIIGINQYAPNYANLNNAVQDAFDLATILNKKYKFKTTTLYNADATHYNILKTLEEFENINPNDNLLIFFAGHGYAKDPLGYIVPVDAPSDTKAGFIPYSTIIEHFRLIPARHILLVIDCCYAGYLMNYRGESEKNKAIELEEQLKSRKFLTSGYKEKVPDGPVGGNTPFVKTLLSILKNNELPKLSIANLFQKIKEELKTIPKISHIPSPMYHELVSVGDEGGSMFLYLENAENKEVKAADNAFNNAIKFKTRKYFDFYFNNFRGNVLENKVYEVYEAEKRVQRQAWLETKKRGTAKAVTDYLIRFTDGFYTFQANEMLRKMRVKSKFYFEKAEKATNQVDKILGDRRLNFGEKIDDAIVKKYHEAVLNLDIAIQLNPEFIQAYLNRIIANNFFKNYESMLNDYNKVIETDTKEAIKLGFYSKRAELKAKMGRQNEALKDMDILINSEKKNSGHYIDRGIVKEILQDYEGAIKDYEIAFSLISIKNSFVVKSMIEDAKKLLQNKK